MDIIYIVGGLTMCNWGDLKCSLRSLNIYGKNVGKVYIVGTIPEWISENIIAIPFNQPYLYPNNFKEKHENLRETLRYISTIDDIPENFIVGFSDVFLNQEVDFNKYPYYGKLTNNGIDLPKTPTIGDEYSYSLISTRKFLERNYLPVRNMTMHRFIKMNKTAIKKSLLLFDKIKIENIDVEPFVLVGNVMQKESPVFLKPIKDYKIKYGREWWKSSDEVTDCFSIKKLKYGGLLDLLIYKYNKKSIYEK